MFLFYLMIANLVLSNTTGETYLQVRNIDATRILPSKSHINGNMIIFYEWLK